MARSLSNLERNRSAHTESHLESGPDYFHGAHAIHVVGVRGMRHRHRRRDLQTTGVPRKRTIYAGICTELEDAHHEQACEPDT